MISRCTRLVSGISILFLVSCSAADPETDLPQRHWVAVLRLKQSVASASHATTARARQVYADALAEFVTRYPAHARGQQVYRSVELEFARQLCRLGRYHEAVPYFRHLIATSPPPASSPLRAELQSALDRESISQSRFAAIRPRMSEDEVVAIVGRPRPEWVRTISKGERKNVCWYYPARGGGVAAVFFASGRVYATDFPHGV